MTFLSVHIDEIKEICASNNVRSLFAFGSVTNDRFAQGSDVDLVVDIAESDPLAYTEHYFSLKERLEAIFKRNVDLLEKKTIRNSFLKQEIEQTKVLLYGS